MARPEHLELAQRLVAGLGRSDAALLASLLRQDAVMEFPQSGERVRGRGAIADVLIGDPTRPAIVGLPAVTSLGPAALALEVPLGPAAEPGSAPGDGQAPTWLVLRFSLEGPSIERVVVYVAEPFEALAYRAAWVTRYDPLREVPDHTEPGPGSGVDRDVLVRWSHLLTGGEVAASGGVYHAAWVGDYPQSGERFVGFEALRKAHDPYPGGLPLERVRDVAGVEDAWSVGPLMPVRVHGEGACWMVEILNDYPDGSRLLQVIVIRLRERLIWRMRTWWCGPFDAPAWRAGLVERYDPFPDGQ
jgi:hypothetical protein